MMRIGQHSPSIPDKSAQVRETASPATQKTAPAAPLPSTPPTAGAGLPPVQSHFSAPVRPSASAKGSGFVTPPPPAKGKAGAKVSPGQLKQAATSAFTMVHGREPDADELKTLEDKGQKLADKGEDYTSIKFALHGELTAAKGGAPTSDKDKLTPEHLKHAVSEVFVMVNNRPPDAKELKALMDKAQKRADQGEDFDSIKFGLHSEVLSARTGEPPITSAPSGAAGSAASDAIKQSVFGSAMGMPSSLGASSALFGKTSSGKTSASSAPSTPGEPVPPEQLKKAASSAFMMVHGREPTPSELKTLEGKAKKLADKGEDYTSIKFALHGELTAAKGGAPTSDKDKLTPEHLKHAISEVFVMVHSRQPSAGELKTLMDKAQKRADQGEDFDSIKFGLHSEILSEKTGEPPITSAPSGAAGSAASDAIKQSVFGSAMGMPSSLGASSALFGKSASVKVSSSTPAPSQAPLRQAVDDAHQLVFGMKASGASAQELMTHAQGLGATHGNDAGAIRTALHSLLTGKSVPAGGSPAPLSKDRLTQAVNEAHQLVFGANPSAAKAIGLMGRALELAGQLKNDFHALKFALHSQMSGKPMPAPGVAHPPPTDTQLRQTLDDAHQVAFKQAAGGPHLGAWMDEARQLATQHGNDLQAVKLALHSRMLEAK